MKADGQRMERMSKLMHHMSGLKSRPAMKGPEMQKQQDQMRKQMNEMHWAPAQAVFNTVDLTLKDAQAICCFKPNLVPRNARRSKDYCITQ